MIIVRRYTYTVSLNIIAQLFKICINKSIILFDVHNTNC